MTAPKLLAFAGSARRDSFNKRLVRAAAQAAREAGAEVTDLDFADLPLPLFDEDVEREGTPENALKLKELMKAHDGFLISTPEYNSSYPALLKNAIDWASRPAEGEPMLACFDGKVAGLLAASPGALGGIRVLPQLRTLLMNIRVHVVPTQFGLGKAHEAFDDAGALVDERTTASVAGVAAATVDLARRLGG